MYFWQAFFLNAQKVVAGGPDAAACEAMFRAQLHGIDEWARDLFVWSDRTPARLRATNILNMEWIMASVQNLFFYTLDGWMDF